jgi:hypothetical protein
MEASVSAVQVTEQNFDTTIKEGIVLLDSIFPIRKMEGTNLHPVREVRGWLFDPAEVAALKTARIATAPAKAALSEGQIAARVFFLFDHGRE